MSKIKRPPTKQRKISEDTKLEKVMMFVGWSFLITLGGFLGFWLIFDNLLDISFINLQLDALTFSFIIFTGTSSAFGFGVATLIKNNRQIRRKRFLDFLVGEFLLCMFALFLLAAYQF
ncbi:MAG: hypothetical protein P8Y70_09310 [Candidatus Lokiarchaeota archaeon]